MTERNDTYTRSYHQANSSAHQHYTENEHNIKSTVLESEVHL